MQENLLYLLGVWTNNKNGHTYLVTGTRINTTNDRDGEIMVEYENDKEKFCRELSEFRAKFTCVTGCFV